MRLFSSLRSVVASLLKEGGAACKEAKPRLESLEDRLTPAANNADFVAGAILTLAGRQFNAATDQQFVDGLNNGSQTLGSVAQAIEKTDDAINLNIKVLFNTYLFRNVDSVGQTFFFNSFKAGLKYQEAKLIIFSSDEYFQVRGGGSNTTYLDAMYADQLGRSVDAIGRAFFGGQLNAATAANTAQVRRVVADGIVDSTEGAQKETAVLYTRLLVRAADSFGFLFFTSQLTAFTGFPASPTDEQTVMAQMVGSQELFDRS